ncbi:MAG: FHA domain-containing protein [Deltaproteobacteria bacterium]|nr:MAG: FHA domain-containing protein [Deltaproteobacteria bacterium]
MSFSVILTEKGGSTQRLDFDAEEITIGRVDENDICLPKGNISKKHTRIVVKDGRIIVLDLKSTNGTYVNGKKLAGPQVISPDDKVYIGDFILNVEPPDLEPAPTNGEPQDGDAMAEMPTMTPARPHYVASEATHRDGQPQPPPKAAPPPPVQGISPVGDDGRTLQLAHDRLIEALDLRRLDLDALGSDELWEKSEAALRQIVARMDQTGELDPHVDREQLVQDVLNEALGLGLLEPYLADDTVSEIMVNGPNQVYVEREGCLERVEKAFSSAQAVLAVIERIVAPLGRHVDESSPLVDARLRDGSRVNAIIPPLALKGPCLTIRKFKRELLTMEHLIGYGTLTPQIAQFLDTCVKVRRNLVISGGTGSGKTTLLNILSGCIPEQERIVTIEDAAELQLAQEHWIQLESRPPNIEGKGQITIRDLVRNALRMRPDRIVVGECRGGEALDMLQAMNTGHDGSLTTLHANSTRDALARMETMVLMSGMDLPVRAIREQIASAVHLVIQQTRFADGSRRVTAISEVSGMEMDVITMQDIFQFQQEGFDDQGAVVGRFVPTGFVPRFYDDLQRRGIPVDMDVFGER